MGANKRKARINAKRKAFKDTYDMHVSKIALLNQGIFNRCAVIAHTPNGMLLEYWSFSRGLELVDSCDTAANRRYLCAAFRRCVPAPYIVPDSDWLGIEPQSPKDFYRRFDPDKWKSSHRNR
jgi:hypothetical protein